MNQILGRIIAKAKEDLQKRKRLLSIRELRGQVKEVRGSELFYKAITKSINDPAVIAEVKLASPSGGIASSVASSDLLAMTIRRVEEYESAGADAISIITEPHFFKGNLDFVGRVKKAVKLSVLQKDFVIDEYQIYEASQEGADALLLISRLVNKKTLKRFVELCLAEGIEPVVEIYSEEDLEKAVATETRIIAVNARDLDTFEVDVERACELMKEIPLAPFNKGGTESGGFILLGFSGIKSAAEVIKYREAGARGVLVGTALMRAMNPSKFLKEIKIQVKEDQKSKIKDKLKD